ATGTDYGEWRNQCLSCAERAAYSGTGPSNLTGGAEPDRVRVAQVTGNLFATLGAQPILGRTFLPEETGRPLFGGGPAPGPTAVGFTFGLLEGVCGAVGAVMRRTTPAARGRVAALGGVR